MSSGDASLSRDLEVEVHELQSELVQEARILETSAARLTLAHTLQTQGSPSPARQLRGPSLEAAPRWTPNNNNNRDYANSPGGGGVVVVDDRAAEKGEELSADISQDSSSYDRANSTTDSPVNDIGWPLPKTAPSVSPAVSSTTIMPPSASRSSRFGAKGAAPRSLGRVFEDGDQDNADVMDGKAAPAEAKESTHKPSSQRGEGNGDTGAGDKEALATAGDQPPSPRERESPLSPLGGLKLAAGATARGGAGASPAWARARHSLRAVPPRSRTPTSTTKKSPSGENNHQTGNHAHKSNENKNSSGYGDPAPSTADTHSSHHKKEVQGLQSSLAAAQETLAQARADAAALVAKHRNQEVVKASESSASDLRIAPDDVYVATQESAGVSSALPAASHEDTSSPMEKKKEKTPVVQFEVTLAEQSIESVTEDLRATFASATATCLGVAQAQVQVGTARAGSVVLPTSVHLQGASSKSPNAASSSSSAAAAAIVAKASDPAGLAASLSKAGLGAATVSTPTIVHQGDNNDGHQVGPMSRTSSTSSNIDAIDVEKLRAALEQSETAAKAYEADAVAAERKASNARAEAAAAKSAAALAAAQRTSDEKRDRQALAQVEGVEMGGW